MVSFLISLDPQPFDQKPTKQETSTISDRISQYPEKVSIADFAGLIQKGHTYCNAIFKLCDISGLRRRAQSNFESQQVFSLDLDNGVFTEVEQIIDVCEDVGYEPFMIYESFSSSEELRKWRVLFLTDFPTYRSEEAKRILRFLNDPFGGDTACVDSARLLFGTSPGKVRYCDEAYEPINLMALRAELPPPAAYKPVESMYFQDGSLEDQGRLLAQLTPNQLKLVRQICREAEEAVRNPVESFYKSHYLAVFNSTVKMAKVSHLFSNVIRRWVLRWINEEEAYLDWKYNPEKVIDQAIIWGRQHLMF